jgi:hypothetical protein
VTMNAQQSNGNKKQMNTTFILIKLINSDMSMDDLREIIDITVIMKWNGCKIEEVVSKKISFFHFSLFFFKSNLINT